MKTKYVLIPWPESQDLMEEEWFREEAVLHPDESASFFIPQKRYNAWLLDQRAASNTIVNAQEA